MPYFCFDSKNIYYEFFKLHDQSPVIVCLNGIQETTKDWQSFKNYFGKDFSVLLLDLPNQGKSDKNNNLFSLEVYAQALIQLTEFLSIKQFVLIGNSFGGCLAQIVALRYPTKILKLILMGTSYRLTADDKTKLNLLLQSINVYEMFSWNPFYKSAVDQYNAIALGFSDLQIDTSRLKNLTKALVKFPNLELELKHCKIQTLVIHGELDSVVEIKESVKLSVILPDAKFFIIPSGSHFLLQNHSFAVQIAVDKFISGTF